MSDSEELDGQQEQEQEPEPEHRAAQVDSFERKSTLFEHEALNMAHKPEGFETVVTPVRKDYEKLFMKDAYRRAHDAELSALATLAMIRSNTDQRDTMMIKLEMDMMLSPTEVDKRLGGAEQPAMKAGRFDGGKK